MSRSINEIKTDVLWALKWARNYILLFSGIGTVAWLAQAGNREMPLSLPVILFLYVSLGGIAGVIVGLLRPLASRDRRGAMVVGALALFPIYLGANIAYRGIKSITDIPGIIGVVIGTAIMGPLFGKLMFDTSRTSKQKQNRVR
jgi:hypothetical protein